MTKIKTPDWIAQGPMDFEFKSYKILSDIERIKSLLHSGNLFDALNQVDEILDYLYLYDAEKITQHEDLSNYEIVGVDFQNFQLIFNHDPDLERDRVMDELCDLALDKYENLHAEIREIWRSIEDAIKCSYIPHKQYLLSDGFVFITTPNNKLHIYYFHKPTKYTNGSWKEFKLQHMQTEDYNKETYMQHIEEIINNNAERIILKVTCEKDTKVEGNAIAVIQNKIFNQLRRDFAF